MVNQSHLGGHQWVTHVDEGVLKYLWEQGHRSLIDIGCGPAGNVIAARKLGFDAIGVDGDPQLAAIPNYKSLIYPHDYTKGPLPTERNYDVAYSTEFLEHVEEQYIPNYMSTFQYCQAVVVTHAPPNHTKGHHHVTLKDEMWWVKKFMEYDFTLDIDQTLWIREASTMDREFMRTTGKYFVNNNVKEPE